MDEAVGIFVAAASSSAVGGKSRGEQNEICQRCRRCNRLGNEEAHRGDGTGGGGNGLSAETTFWAAENTDNSL